MGAAWQRLDACTCGGAKVSVFLGSAASDLTSVASHQLAALRAFGIQGVEPPAKLPETDLALDALLGYSLKGAPREPLADLIRQANALQAPILSLDVPSGVDPDTGQAYEPAVMALATLTLALPKPGLQSRAARPFVGELWLADISIPSELYARLGILVPPIFAADDLIRLPLPESGE